MTNSEFLSMIRHLLENRKDEGRVTNTPRSEMNYNDYKDMRGSKQARGRVADIILYPTFEIRHFTVIEKILKSDIYNYALIFHDKDMVYCDTVIVKDVSSDYYDDDVFFQEDLSFFAPPDEIFFNFKRAHVHLVLYFQEARTNTAVARDLGIAGHDVRVYGFLDKRLAYLTHAFNNDKYRYPDSDICGTSFMLEHYVCGVDCVKLTTTELLIRVSDILGNVANNYGYMDIELARFILNGYHLGAFFESHYYKVRDIVNNISSRFSSLQVSQKHFDALEKRDKKMQFISEQLRQSVKNNCLLIKENIELKETIKNRSVRNKEPPVSLLDNNSVSTDYDYAEFQSIFGIDIPFE